MKRQLGEGTIRHGHAEWREENALLVLLQPALNEVVVAALGAHGQILNTWRIPIKFGIETLPQTNT
jgi:hypothetical protein